MEMVQTEADISQFVVVPLLVTFQVKYCFDRTRLFIFTAHATRH